MSRRIRDTISRGLALQNVLTAFHSLRSNRMRSILTSLGIVIGISTMTTVTSLLQGFSSNVTESFNSLGTSTMYITRTGGPSMAGGQGRMQDIRPELEVWYTEQLMRVEGVEYAVPVTRGSASVKTSDGIDMTVQLMGTTDEWLDAGSRDLEYGRFFTPYEISAGQSICIIGSEVSERLFGTDSPLGCELEIEGSRLTVIGTLEEFGEVMGQDQDDIVIIPWTIFSRWGDSGRSLSIMVKVESPEIMGSTISGVRNCMRNLRGLGIDEDDDFEIMSTEELQEGFETVSSWMFIGLLGLAGLSLLVGSVGIANIMLVSVTQRIREIGIRKALGATRVQILLQFLTESATLSISGGFIGIITGYLIAWGASSMVGVPARLEPISVAVAFAVSMVVGIIAGIFPAGKAAALEPLRALQHSN